MHLSERLCSTIYKSERIIIGLMSGMSMDGVDLAFVKIAGTYPNLDVKMLGSHFRPYPAVLRQRLQKATSANAGEVSALGFVVAEEFASCVAEFMSATRISSAEVDAIGSHGQTLFHSSLRQNGGASTLQVGHPSIIAERTGILTIGNFRVRDIAVGGQGAPLVSLADFLLYRIPGQVIAVNNLGSISNVTVVTENIDDVLAFDTGPANMAIDYFARRVLNRPEAIDTEGKISASGVCIEPLLKELLALPFFSKAPPKAAGYHDFGPAVLDTLSQKYATESAENLLRTAVEFAAVSIRDAYQRYLLPKFPTLRKALFSGGGVRNQTLMRRIRESLPEIAVETFSPAFSDAKEAVAFALLAHETLSGRAGNVIGATGATKRTILGEIAL
jgi:anhydro-N-acetylmuramic acid kinase